MSSGWISTGIVVATLQAEIHPPLQVQRPDDDLLAHLVGLHVDEAAHRCEVAPPKGPSLEGRVPRVVPVQFEPLDGRQVPEVVDRNVSVVGHEPDAGKRIHRRALEGQRARPHLQGVRDAGVDDDLRLLFNHGERLAADLIPLDAGPRPHLDDATDQRLSVVRSNHQVAREELGQSLGESSRRMAELLVDIVRQQIPEGLDIRGADLELEPDLLLLDVVLGDGGGEHRLGADDGVGHRPLAGQRQRE